MIVREKDCKIVRALKNGYADGSRGLFKDMPDQSVLRFVDVLEQRGLVHAHLLRKFARVYPSGMIEKSPAIRFQQDLFLLGGKDIEDPVDGGVIIADRKNLEPPPFLLGIRDERMEVLRVPDHTERQTIVLEDDRVVRTSNRTSGETG